MAQDPMWDLIDASYLSDQTFHVPRSIAPPDPVGHVCVTFSTKPAGSDGMQTTSPAHLAAAREKSIDMLSGAVDSVLGASSDTSGLVEGSPLLDDLTTALASGQFSYLRSGFVPSGVNPESSWAAPLWSVPIAVSGGRGSAGVISGGPASADLPARSHGTISPLRVAPATEEAKGDGVMMTLEGDDYSGGGYPPTANDDAYSGGHDSTFGVPDGEGILCNDDLGFESAVLSDWDYQGPGQLSVASGGGFTYTPPSNWVGCDGFTYTIANLAGSSSAAVTIAIWNWAPYAVDDYYYTTHDSSLDLTDPEYGLKWNDWDDDDPMSDLVLNVTAGPYHAKSFSYENDGTFSYEPQDGWVGSDTFTYTLHDGFDESEPAVVTIGVGNMAPSASDDYYYTTHDSSLDVTDPEYGLKWNDWDDDDPMSDLVLNVTAGPYHAKNFSFENDGTFTYEPEDGWVGSDTFTYTLDDGIELSDEATVTIGVGNEAPTASTIEDVWHWARDPMTTEEVSLWDHFDDVDDTDQQLTYTVEANSNPGVVGTSIDAGTGTLTLSFTGTPGISEVTVRATDRPGEIAETTFPVWSVDVQGVTVEEHYWGDDDTTWFSAGDVLWASDEQRWSTTVLPAEAEAFVSSTVWVAEPWVGQTEPIGNGFVFAESPSSEPAKGSPTPGDWFIYAIVVIGNAIAQSLGDRVPLVEITGITWEGVNAGDGETNLSPPGGPARTIYPERNAPAGPEHDRVNVCVTIQPAMPIGMSGTLRVKIYDPDNAQPGAADPNDDFNTTVPVDNREPGGRLGEQSLAMTPGTFDLTFFGGQTTELQQTETQEVTITDPQPGNNYLAVVHHKSEVVDNLKFRDNGMTLYYQKLGSQNTYDVPPDHHSEVLEVRRTLWVESDHMGAPGPNDGPFSGLGDLGKDDDHFDDEFTPADPQFNVLSALLEPAYVRVLALPAEYDTRNVTLFKHYQQTTSVDPDIKDAESSQHFWDAYMLGAYEWSLDRDNDPNSQAWLAGFSEAGDDGTNFVLEETVRDLWAEPQFENMVPYAIGLDRLSAHEALHRFFDWHGTDPAADEGIMDRDTLFTADTISLTARQIRIVQAKDWPLCRRQP